MLLECSKVGASIDVHSIPRPVGVPLLRWLQSFPSYGYVFSVRPRHVADVQAHFESKDIACAVVGEVTEDPHVWLRDGERRALLWDVGSQPFINARSANEAEAARG